MPFSPSSCHLSHYKRLYCPALPVPPPLRSADPGSWANVAIALRLPDVIERTAKENDYENEQQLQKMVPWDICDALAELCDEVRQNKPLRPLKFLKGDPDAFVWAGILHAPITNGETWLNTSWLISEFYGYRRVLEAVGYFRHLKDPFEHQKRLGVSSCLNSVQLLARKCRSICGRCLTFSGCDDNSQNLALQEVVLKFALLTSLWGNQVDLSLWPCSETGGASAMQNSPSNGELCSSLPDVDLQKFNWSLLETNILANRFPEIWTSVKRVLAQTPKSGGLRWDIITDNAGYELICDLTLALLLLRSGLAAKVTLRLKAAPTFVCDAMEKDVVATVDTLTFQTASNRESCRWLGEQLVLEMRCGRLVCKPDHFWNVPLFYWEMPPQIYEELCSNSDFVICKGDANYRRLLGDCIWPVDTPFEQIVQYFPSRLIALRAFKSEIICGIPKDIAEATANQDPQWLLDGKYGAVQFFEKA